jgi:hypothetical protein
MGEPPKRIDSKSHIRQDMSPGLFTPKEFTATRTCDVNKDQRSDAVPSTQYSSQNHIEHRGGSVTPKMAYDIGDDISDSLSSKTDLKNLNNSVQSFSTRDGQIGSVQIGNKSNDIHSIQSQEKYSNNNNGAVRIINSQNHESISNKDKNNNPVYQNFTKQSIATHNEQSTSKPAQLTNQYGSNMSAANSSNSEHQSNANVQTMGESPSAASIAKASTLRIDSAFAAAQCLKASLEADIQNGSNQNFERYIYYFISAFSNNNQYYNTSAKSALAMLNSMLGSLEKSKNALESLIDTTPVTTTTTNIATTVENSVQTSIPANKTSMPKYAPSAATQDTLSLNPHPSSGINSKSNLVDVSEVSSQIESGKSM